MISINDMSIIFDLNIKKNNSIKSTLVKSLVGGNIINSEKVSTVSALDNINLSISSGDRVGIIGHNGSGKTTLLRTIAGVYRPAHGSIFVNGSVVSLLNIHFGMDIDATGAENIHLRSKIFGLSDKQIKLNFDDIVEFSGLGEYINTSIRHYSSGMLLRLGFSIATSIPGDIVLMDEWISVGDSDFSKKAEIRLKHYINSSKILVLATHNIDLAKSVCNKIYMLERGKLFRI
jgi:lipopolysaccharide transport system ATP-binding protein